VQLVKFKIPNDVTVLENDVTSKWSRFYGRATAAAKKTFKKEAERERDTYEKPRSCALSLSPKCLNAGKLLFT
jgi:hypothetical protein